MKDINQKKKNEDGKKKIVFSADLRISEISKKIGFNFFRRD